MNAVEELNKVLERLHNTVTDRIFVSGNVIGLFFPNQTYIRAYSYSFVIKDEKTYYGSAFDLEVSDKLNQYFEPYQYKVTVKEIEHDDLSRFHITFEEIKDLEVILHSYNAFPQKIDVSTEKYDFEITQNGCRIVSEKVEKDYKSFSAAARSRFRFMAKALGYEQITGIVYVKEREGWYETFNLQYSQYGNPFFYLNYGVIVPDQFPMTREELRDSGWHLGGRLSPPESNSFAAGNKKQIEESAELALELYQKKVVPWFESLTQDKIKDEINTF